VIEEITDRALSSGEIKWERSNASNSRFASGSERKSYTQITCKVDHGSGQPVMLQQPHSLMLVEPIVGVAKTFHEPEQHLTQRLAV
jgi:hypothetical protein